MSHKRRDNAQGDDKQVVGILYNWQSHPDWKGRLQGQTVLDMPRAGARRSDWVNTTEVIDFFRVDGQLHCETKNSIYMLCDEHPFQKGQ